MLVEGRLIPWPAESLALFGVNGAGKTRFLQAVKQLLGPSAGAVASQATLVVRFGQPVPLIERPVDKLVEEDWYAAGDDLMAEYLSRVDGEFSVIYSMDSGNGHVDVELAYERWLRLLCSQPRCGDERFAQLRDPDNEADPEVERLFEAIRGQRLMEISSGGPDWVEMRPFVMEEPAFPAIAQHMDTVESAIRASEAADPHNPYSSLDHSPINFHTLQTLNGTLLRGGPFYPNSWIHVDGTVADWIGVGSLDPDDLSDEDLLTLTQGVIRGSGGSSEETRAAAIRWGTAATSVLRDVLPTPVELFLHVPAEEGLLAGETPEWRASPHDRLLIRVHDGPSILHRGFPLSRLSFAERRWAVLAILHATGALRGTSLLVVDEPERGIHRAAEARAMDRLVRLSHSAGAALWAASHSPSLLSMQSIVPVKVEASAILKLESHARDVLLDLGLTPADVLSSRRGFLLVEGIHDEVVLRELLGDEIASLGVEILPLHGGTKLPGSIESQMLFDYTEAIAFALLDAISMSTFTDAWATARELQADSSTDAAKVHLLTRIPDSEAREETKWLRTWLMRALDKGVGDRAHPVGLSRRDVVEYLPVGELVPGATAWEELRAVHVRRLEEREGNVPKDFKRWLEREKGADFSIGALRLACRSMDHIPDDLTSAVNEMSDVILRKP